MQRELPRARGGPAALTFDAKLDNEQDVLETLLSSLARGQLPPETWAKFHLAAVRDDRLAEVAFAYENTAQGKRLKTMAPGVAAEFFFRASTFFSEAFGDELGAVSYLERALAASPTHAEAFEKIELLLTKSLSWRKLADVIAGNAPHHPRADQAALLRRAADLYEKDAADDRIVEVYQQVLRLEPQDETTRDRLEARYAKANRHRDVTRLLEQALTTEPPPSATYAIKARSRLVDMYAGQLHEPERSMPHIEAILEEDPSHDEARRVAAKLIEVKGLAARAAAALASAYGHTGVPSDVAKFLAIELEHTRGPKRKDVLRKIGVLRQDRLNDAAGAYEAFEAALALDPTDENMRERYAQIAGKLGKELDAARTLGRVGASHKDPALRAKLTAEVGKLFLAGGDAKRAKTAFVAVLAMPELEAPVNLAAARALCAIYASEGDHTALADALERVALLEPDPEMCQIANEELAQLATDTLKDPRRAIGAWKRLLATSARPRALAALEPLYEATGDNAELAQILDARAKDTDDPKEARRIAFRAAEVLATTTQDAARVSEAWRAIAHKYGAARDVHAKWIPLLEAQRQWAELGGALEAEVDLAPEAERASILVRLGGLRLQRTRDVVAAIDAFRRALELDPQERASRVSLEKLLGLGDHRLEAAAVLEPLYRAEGASAGLLRILDLKAQLAKEPDARLAALEEALAVASQGTADRTRALDLVGRGLAEAVATDRPLGPWLERLDRLTPPGSDSKRRAAVLGRALGPKPVESPALLDLAKRTAEALAASGDVAAALEVYRRALAFEPTSSELLTSVDDLLRDQGDPADRIALYRAALARDARDPSASRKRELLHKIGAIQRNDVGDLPAAIETYQSALADAPDDQEAQTALAELYTATGQWGSVCDLLEMQLKRAAGDEARRMRLQLAEVASAHDDPARAVGHLRELLDQRGSLGQEDLASIERLAEAIGDLDMQRESLRRRAAATDDPREQVAWLDKLAGLELALDADAAVTLWKRAAQIAEKAGDDEQARRLYERAREIAPRDGETALRLADLLERASDWAALPALYAVLLEATELPRARVGVLMRHARVLAEHLDDPAAALVSAAQAFELATDAPDRQEVLTVFSQLALRGKGTHIFAQAMDDAIAKLGGETAELAAQRADLALAKARVMAANREGRPAAAAAYRAVLDDALVDEARIKAALLSFEALLGSVVGQAQAPEAAESRRADRRWLMSWKVDHAPEAGLVPALLSWATAEEGFADLPRALELYRRAQSLDPEDADVLAGISRLALSTGDTAGAIAALTARRDRSDGATRTALDLEIATILVERTERPEEALPALGAVLQSTPQDEVALALAAKLLALPVAHTRAVALLERTCDVVEDPEVRAHVLRHLLEARADPPDPHELRHRWYERLLDLRRAQGNLDLALHTALAAAAELPTVESLWDRAESLARELERPNEVAELYQVALAQPLPKDSALALGQRAATFHEEWFEDSAGVVRILERVLEIDASASWAFDRLKLLFDADERWDELFALYDRALATADADRQVGLLEDAAQIAKDFANNSDRAIGYLEQLLARKPGDARLVAALERLYERHGSHRELITLLSAQIGALRAGDAQRARARIALLWLDEIGDSSSALAVVEEILQHPDRAGIDVFDLLEKVLAGAPPHAEARESVAPPPEPGQERRRRDSIPAKSKRVPVRQRAAVLLRELYTEAGRESDLVRILEVELEAITNVKERIRRHNQIASLHAKLGHEAAATEHLASLVMLEPEVKAHRAMLADLAAKIGRYDRLAEVLAAAADECEEDALRVELLMHAAEVQASHLRDSGKAIDLLLRVLALPGISKVSALAAARRAEPLLEAAGRSWERLDVLERIAELEPDAVARHAARTTTALLATELGENARAITAWEARLEEAGPAFAQTGSSADALDGLVVLLEREKRWSRLIEILDRRAGTERGAAERRADRVHIARVQGSELGAVPEAIEAWRAVDAEFGETDESMDALASLLERAQRWSELGILFERGAARATTPERRAELLRHLGDLQGQRLTAFDVAVASYEAALTANPRNDGARIGLRVLLDAPVWRGPAVTVLLKAFAATDEWPLALELTDHRLAAAADAPARVKVLREVAKIAEERAHDAGHAFHAVRRALLELPEDASLEAELARLGEATGEWQAYADTYRQIVEQAEGKAEPSWIARRRLTLGEVLERKLDSAPRALESFLKAAQEAPTEPTTARAVIRAAGATGRWDAAATVLVAFARATGGVNAELLDAVEAAAQGPAAWDGATKALASAVATASDLPPTIPRDLEARLGAWHRDRRGDPEAAEAAFARALTHDSLNADLLGSLAQIQRRAKGRPLVDSLLRLSQATGGDLELLREAAEIAIGSVADRALAKSILESLMRLARERWVGDGAAVAPSLGSPVDVGGPGPLVEWTLDHLVHIHEEEGNLERTVELLVETARLPFPREVARRMLHEAARLARSKLGDTERAILLYSTLFDEDTSDTDSVRALVEMYEVDSRFAELLALRTRQIANATTAAERLVLRLAAARLQTALGNVEGCIEALRSNLAEVPRHPETCTALFEVLEDRERFGELSSTLAHQADLAERDGEAVAAADLWERAANVSELRQGDAYAALEHHKRVVALEARSSSLDALARLSSAHGDHASAAQYLDKLHARAADAQKGALILRLADALTASSRADLARARLEEALAGSPADEPIRARLALAYRHAAAWEPLAELLSRGAEHAPDKATRLGRLLEAAELYTVQCKKPDLGIPLLEQASDLEPDNRAIKLSLADALGAAGRFADARTLLRALIESFGGRRPKERAPVHYYLARLELKMGDRARSLVELDAATRIDPANPQILRALAELARDDGQLDRAERSYRALLVALKRPEDAEESAPMVRSEVLLELASIAERQGEQERAGEILESALETASKSEVEAQRLETSLRERGKFDTLVRALSGRLARAGNTPSAAPILSDLAVVLDVQLGHLADAFVARLRAVSLMPGSVEAHDAALGLARRTDGVGRYVDEVEKLVTLAQQDGDHERACMLLLRLGRVAEEELHDDSRAAALYKRARGLRLGDRELEALRALDRVYERLGDREAQASVLAERVAAESKLGDRKAGADALYRFAALRLDSEATLDEGCERLAAALDAQPDTERAVGILKAAAAAHPTSTRVLDLYERVSRTPGRERSLIDALTRQAAMPGASTDPLQEAVKVAQGIGDGALTETLLRLYIDRAAALDETPKAGWALAALADLREGAGDVADAIALKRRATEVSEPDDARRLRFDIAHLASDALGDLALAAETYEGVLEHEPADREAWAPLLDVYRRTHQVTKLVALLGKVVDFVDDNAERSRLRLERVRVMMNDQGLGDDAAVPLREIVDDDPTQVEAAILLAGILERTGREDELSELLDKQIDSAKDRSDAASVGSLSLRLAALQEKRSPVDAKATLYAALEWEPKNLEVLSSLARLHADPGDTADRADILERILALQGGDEAEKIAMDLHALRIELGDVEGAERALELGYRANPRGSIGPRLETLYRERGAWAKLAEMFAIDAATQSDAGTRVARLREAAALFRTQVNDPARGAALLRDARNTAPEDPALLMDLVDVLAEANDFGGAVTELSSAMERAVSTRRESDGATIAALAPVYARRAAMRIKLGERDAAATDQEHAVKLGGASFARELIDQLTWLRSDAAGRADTAAERSFAMRLAEILPVAGDADQARTLLSELLKQNPKDRDALRLLGRIEEHAQHWDAVTATYRRLVTLEEGDAVVETALRLADACERAGRFADARGALERARLAAPQDDALRGRLASLYERSGAYKELAEMSLADAKSAKDVAGRFVHLVRAGSLLVQHGADPDVAANALAEAHALRPSDAECTVLLADAYTLAGRSVEAVELINQAIASHKGKRSRELGALYHRLARVAHHGGDQASELAWLASALDMDGQSGFVASELATVAMGLGQMEVATRALRTITMLKPPVASPISKAMAYQYLAEIARQQGDVKRAVMLLKRAVDEDPALDSARALLDSLQE